MLQQTSCEFLGENIQVYLFAYKGNKWKGDSCSQSQDKCHRVREWKQGRLSPMLRPWNTFRMACRISGISLSSLLPTFSPLASANFFFLLLLLLSLHFSPYTKNHTRGFVLAEQVWYFQPLGNS